MIKNKIFLLLAISFIALFIPSCKKEASQSENLQSKTTKINQINGGLSKIQIIHFSSLENFLYRIK